MTIWQRLSYTPPSSEHIYYLQLNGESNFINSHDCRGNKLIYTNAEVFANYVFQ